MSPSHSHTPRLAAGATLLIALAAFGMALLGADGYTVHARFLNAGLLVEGGEVQLAGREVGTISEISLRPDGVADIELSLNDDDAVPLRYGARASIRAVSQAGVANRFVDLTPGSPSAAELPDGAVLGLDQTSGIVDIDALLDSFGPAQRSNLRKLIARSGQVYAGSGSRYFNGMLAKLDPALSELNGLTAELARDRTAVRSLVRKAGDSATAIASRRPDLSAAVGNTARALGAIARERRALAGTLTRAPNVLAQARGTLRRAGVAVSSLRPALRDIPGATPSLREFLLRTTSTLPKARPVVAELRRQLPALNRSLAGLRPLERPAVTALRSTSRTLAVARPILRATRIYGSDLILGIFNGLAGLATGNYTEKGHYARLEFTQNLETALAGGVAPLIEMTDPIPGIIDVRTQLTRRCPGGNVPPAIDGSSPWIPDLSLCTPAHNTSPDVNEP